MSASTSLFIALLVLLSGALGLSFGPEGAFLPAGVIGLLILLAFARSALRERRFRKFVNERLAPLEKQRVRLSPTPRLQGVSLKDAPRTATVGRANTGYGQLILGALLVRVFAGLALNLSGLNLKLAPDSIGYQIYGTHIAQAWMDPRYDPSIVPGYKALSFWQHVNAVGVMIFGDYAYIFLGLVNCFVGVYAAWLVGLIAKELFGPAAQRRAFILAAFFPSIVMWTSINLRDAWSYVFVCGAVLAAQRLRSEWSTTELIRLVVCLAMMPLIRSYMLVLTVAGLLASFFVVRIRQIPYAIVGVAVVAVMFGKLEQSLELRVSLADPAQNFQTLHALKVGMGEQKGETHYDTGVDISTPQGALLYLPLGVSRFLFSPFPWRVRKPQQAIAFFEVIIWFFVFIASVRGMSYGVRKDLARFSLPMLVAVVTCLAYSLVESNEGTAFRHRGQVLMLAFVYAAGYYTLRAQKKEQAAERVRRRTSELRAAGHDSVPAPAPVHASGAVVREA